MKKSVFPALCASVILATNVVSCAKKEEAASLPDPLPTDVIHNTAKRTELKTETKPYTPLKEDAPSDHFMNEKYSMTKHNTWNCHDPKLFQDPVSGRYFVYSTGWQDGVQIRSSSDLIHWAKHRQSALWSPEDVSLKYGHTYWDDDFLQWVGYATNDGTAYSTKWYSANKHPNSWAPTVVYQNGKYYMFHGIITDCLSMPNGTIHPAACITLAIADKPEGPFVPAKKYDSKTYKNSNLVRYVWTNKSPQNTQIGYSLCKNTAEETWEKGFGTIDPEFVFDISTGELMKYKIGKTECYALTYGSWKGGIALIYVDAKTFKPVNQQTGKIMDAPLDTIDGNYGLPIAGGEGAAYEGAQLLYNSGTGYYYLFVSMGDLNIQYRVGVGRSDKIEGPYSDPSGISMSFDTQGGAAGYHKIGGKIIGAHQIGDGYGFTSPGGQSILKDKDGRILFACHTRTNYLTIGDFTLQIHQMFFNEDGWPVLNWNEYAGEAVTPPALSMKEIAGTYQAEITKRSRVPKTDGTAAQTQEIHIDEKGTITGAMTGTVTLNADGKTAVFTLKDSGTFTGLFLLASDWSKKEVADAERKTITFTALNSTDGDKKGEYLFGNREGD